MRIITSLSLSLLVGAVHAQTLFSEDFEDAPQFSLNTSDAGSLPSANNIWTVNNAYAGGSAESTCIIPVTFDVPSTPAQPLGLDPSNGNYLHTLSTLAQGGGILCCCFAAADGLCTDPDNIFAAMSTDVSTVGQPDVSLKFWWICAGGTQNYGEVWYSTNSGSSWTQCTAPITQYRNQSNWAEQTVNIPAFGDQSTLRVGFRFHNGTAFSASDPGFGVDNVRIVANSTSSITCALSVNSFCSGSSFGLTYTANGSFNAGNIFTAQLSDAAGSFAAPLTIGSLTSTGSGTISCTIPVAQAAGSAYRVRVVSSTPVVTGSNNGSNITIVQGPYAGENNSLTVCSGDAAFTLETGGDSGGTWSGPSPVMGGQYDPATMDPGTYIYTLHADPPCADDSAAITITELAGANAGTSAIAHICKNTGTYELIDLLGGDPDAGGTWIGWNGQPFSGTFDSYLGHAGIYTYTVEAGGSCGSDEAVVTVELGEHGRAGVDTTWTVCATQLPVDLYSFLTNASTDGYWYLNGIPFNGTATSNGPFMYIDFGDAPCPNDTAFISLQIQLPSYAGENNTVTFCPYDPPADLFAQLGGIPQPGGTWTGPGGVFSGTFHPASDQPGLYTYTVEAGEPCPSDEAVLAVLVDPCLGVHEATAAEQAYIVWSGSDADGAQLFTGTFDRMDRVEVIDACGRLVLSRPVIRNTGAVRIDAGTLASGSYSAVFRAADEVRVVRFVR